ncbi:MAG: hypothetical protein ABW153_09240 [Sedimenticola sp.]
MSIKRGGENGARRSKTWRQCPQVKTKEIVMDGKALVGVLAGIIVAAVLGLFVGWSLGMERGESSIVDMTVNKDARDVQSQIATLKHLRAGEIDQAIELIEANMDDQLVMFDPVEPYPGISDSTYAEVAKALKQCKAYRAEYPRKSKRSFVDEMVKNVLEQGELN